MSTPRLPSILLAAAVLGAGPLSASESCDALSNLWLPDVTVSAVKELDRPAKHCRVEGRIGHHIGFHVLLPHEWNGRFAMGGQGGFAGTSGENQAMAFGQVLQKGYATAGTDTGHQARSLDGTWALHDLEAIANYGHVAVHRTSEVAKAMIAAHYDRRPDDSFFLGCSNGGRQALQEAQRYPEDFDVILAGAPALDFDGLAAAFLYITQRMYPDMEDLSAPAVSMEDRTLLRQAILDRCDARDDITDQVLADPSACDFDPRSLECTSGNSEGCLTAADLEAIEAIYDGPSTPDGEPLHVGFPFGAEDTNANGWGSWLVGRENGAGPGVPNAAFGFGTGLARNFIYQDPAWSYEGYDFSTWGVDTQAVQATLNADNPDLDAFRERGGKLLMFHGWSDSALSARASIDYVEAVYQRDPAAREALRLFMMPGVLHCAGGKGPSRVDWLTAMEQWHETGKPPTEVDAAFLAGEGGRKLCAWPKKAIFVGSDDRSPDAFECR